MEFFNFIRAYVDPETNRIIPKYICSCCSKEMDEPEKYEIPCRGGVAEYHRTKVWCSDCGLPTTLGEWMESLSGPDPKEVEEITAQLNAMSPEEKAAHEAMMNNLFLDSVRRNFG